jgi:hypothetical protein
LWEAVCEHELEGLVAKRLHEPYLPGERAWVKVKNRAYRVGSSTAKPRCAAAARDSSPSSCFRLEADEPGWRRPHTAKGERASRLAAFGRQSLASAEPGAAPILGDTTRRQAEADRTV